MRAETVLVARVPAADPLRALSWPGDAASGRVPPHVTLLYPFVPEADLGAARPVLLSVLARQLPFEVGLGGFGRFRRVLWLRPEPPEPWLALMADLRQAWPELAALGHPGQPVPHLTIRTSPRRQVLDEAEAVAAPLLPIRSQVSEVQTYVFGAGRWSLRETYPIG